MSKPSAIGQIAGCLGQLDGDAAAVGVGEAEHRGVQQHEAARQPFAGVRHQPAQLPGDVVEQHVADFADFTVR